MTERRRGFVLSRSLDAKMLYMVLCSLFIAVAVYLSVYGLSSLAQVSIPSSPGIITSSTTRSVSGFSFI